MGSDPGVEVEEERTATEELRHPRVNLGQQTEIDLEEGPWRDPQRQPGRVDKDLARAVDRFDRAFDNLGAAFRVEVDSDPRHVGAGFHNAFDRELWDLLGLDHQGQVLLRGIAAAAQIDVAQREWKTLAGVQKPAQLLRGLQQFGNEHPAVGRVDDLAAAALEVAERRPVLAVGRDRHFGAVAIALDPGRRQRAENLSGSDADLLVEHVCQTSALAFELFAIRPKQKRARTALDAVGTVDGSVGGVCHLAV